MSTAARTRPPRGRHVAPRSVHGRALPLSVAALSAAAGAIHAAVIREHVTDFWLFGAFFAVAAVLQVAWAWLILARPSRRLYLLGAAGHALVVLIWLVSRTIGLPIGPDAGVAVGMAVPDVVATACEAVAALGALLILRRSAGEPPAVVAGSSAGVLAAGLGTIALFAFLFGPAGRPDEGVAAAPGSGGAHVVHFAIVGIAAGLFLVLAVVDWVRNGPRKLTWSLKDGEPQEPSTGTPSSPSR